MTAVGVAGLGAMGSRIAARLAAAGHKVTVWNRSAGKVELARAECRTFVCGGRDDRSVLCVQILELWRGGS
jgi:3-hydroxyisobutyrate dehydrogenase-like beta-hydroxyacid dehydrogenase